MLPLELLLCIIYTDSVNPLSVICVIVYYGVKVKVDVWCVYLVFWISPKLTGGTRKNHPLCHETIRWKSDVPLTEGQLRSKRDEFWDTAPAFEGRKEIWDALRAAAIAAEAVDFELAQAILDGANVSVPNGKGIHSDYVFI